MPFKINKRPEGKELRKAAHLFQPQPTTSAGKQRSKSIPQGGTEHSLWGASEWLRALEWKMAPLTSGSPVAIHLQLAGSRNYYHHRGTEWNELVVSGQLPRPHSPAPQLLPNTYCSPRLQLWLLNNHPHGLKLWGPPGTHCCFLFHTMTGMFTHCERDKDLLMSPLFLSSSFP